MKKLRLLVTTTCNRACEGCCNKDWDLDNLQSVSLQEASTYPEVYITGGEPLLFLRELISTIYKLRDLNKDIKIFLYTAWNVSANDFISVAPILDGLTYTLHAKEDVDMFFKLNNRLPTLFPNVSYRLNVFKGVDLSRIIVNTAWKIKDNIEWIPNCPLPEGEVIAKLEGV
jgi:organic radical activating enzyme